MHSAWATNGDCQLLLSVGVRSTNMHMVAIIMCTVDASVSLLCSAVQSIACSVVLHMIAYALATLPLQTMVQDDEYVSISSANLNQRSLEGTRDTELGMGAWQPAYTLANAKHGRGGGGTARKPGEHDNVDAGPASGHMDDRGGNYADVDENRDNSGDYLFGDQQNVSSSGRSGTGGHRGHQDNTGVTPGNVAGASHVGAVDQPDSEPSTRTPSQTGHSQIKPSFSTSQTHAAQLTQSQPVENPPVGTLLSQPPSANWGQAADSQIISAAPKQSIPASPSQGQSASSHTAVANASEGHKAGNSSQLGQEQIDSQHFQQDQYQPQGQADQRTSQEEEKDKGQPARGGVRPGQKVAYPKGEVYGYRMALWLEHLSGKWDPVYDQPHSLECIRRVNQLAEQNWLQFNGEEDVDMSGHLIMFPVVVSKEGNMIPRMKDGAFSDIDNNVQGKKHRPIPAMFLN